jgi:putative SOS response-associated peptidase YedK
MCGRYVLTNAKPLADAFKVEPPSFTPSWNISPTQSAPVLRATLPVDENDTTPAGFAMTNMRWGLVPSWSKGPNHGPTLFNARSEGAAEKPAYREAFAERRCLIPADGFYEWQSIPGSKDKQPYYIKLAKGPLVFAGLWETWTSRRDGSVLHSFCILTTEPNDLIADLHSRMPVILPRVDWDTWLLGTIDDALDMLRPYNPDEMMALPVGQAVGNVKNNDPSLIKPLLP